MSTRILLYNKYDDCFGSRSIDRSKPPVLQQSYLSDSDWTAFCDKIDKVLDSMNQVTAYNRVFAGITILVVFISSAVITIVSTLKHSPSEPTFDPATGTYVDPNASSSGGGPNVLVFTAIPVGFTVLGVLATAYSRRLFYDTGEDIKALCKDMSNHHPRLSFALRNEPYYDPYGLIRLDQQIEVLVRPHGGATPEAAGVQDDENPFVAFAGDVEQGLGNVANCGTD
jgi:hypothetical protein